MMQSALSITPALGASVALAATGADTAPSADGSVDTEAFLLLLAALLRQAPSPSGERLSAVSTPEQAATRGGMPPQAGPATDPGVATPGPVETSGDDTAPAEPQQEGSQVAPSPAPLALEQAAAWLAMTLQLPLASRGGELGVATDTPLPSDQLADSPGPTARPAVVPPSADATTCGQIAMNGAERLDLGSRATPLATPGATAAVGDQTREAAFELVPPAPTERSSKVEAEQGGSRGVDTPTALERRDGADARKPPLTPRLPTVSAVTDAQGNARQVNQAGAGFTLAPTGQDVSAVEAVPEPADRAPAPMLVALGPAGGEGRSALAPVEPQPAHYGATSEQSRQAGPRGEHLAAGRAVQDLASGGATAPQTTSSGSVPATSADTSTLVASESGEPGSPLPLAGSAQLPGAQPARRRHDVELGAALLPPASREVLTALVTGARELVNPSTPQPVHVQVLRGLESALERPGHTVRLALQPEGLGSVDLQVTLGAGGVRVQIAAERADTQQLLQAGTPQLAQALEQRGVPVEQVLVQLSGGHIGGGDFRQPRQAPASTARVGRVRGVAAETAAVERGEDVMHRVDLRI